MTTKTWVGNGGGAWAMDANWSPAGAPGAGDDALILFPDLTDDPLHRPTTYPLIAGPGTSASLTIGGVAHLTGTFDIGALQAGTATTYGDLELDAGAITAASATVGNGSLDTAAGTVLDVQGTFALGEASGPATVSTFGVGGTARVGALELRGGLLGYNGVFVGGTLEVGAGGAVAAAPGTLTVDPGAMLSGGGRVSATIVNNGTLLATGNLALEGTVSGPGAVRIGPGTELVLNSPTPSAAGISFDAPGGTLLLQPFLALAESGPALNLAGPIHGFRGGDTIQVSSLGQAVTSAGFTPGAGGGTLTVQGANGVLGTLAMDSDLAGQSIRVTPQATAGLYSINILPPAGPVAVGTAAPDAFAWAATGGGAWADPANWTSAVPGNAPGAANLVTLTGPAYGPTQVVTGPAAAASLLLLGTTTLDGTFTIGAMAVGTAAAAGGLDTVAGTLVAAGSMTVNRSSARIAGAGSRLAVAGTLRLDSTATTYPADFASIAVAAGAALQAGSVILGEARISVDAASTLSIGTAPAGPAGTISIGAGATLRGEGTVVAANGTANDGTILAEGSLGLRGAVSGAGRLEIAAGGTLTLDGVSTEGVAFDGAAGTLAIDAEPAFLQGSTPVLTEQGIVTGFALGDAIQVYLFLDQLVSATYQPGTGGLGTLTLSGTRGVLGSLTLAGDYSGQVFEVKDDAVRLAPPGAFLTTDTASGASAAAPGSLYAGPVAGLARQFIWASPDGAAMAATVGNVFLHGGAGDDALSVSSGTNVLDGGAGSNFLVGGRGTDGGTDTFFVDGRSDRATWSTVANFHHGDAVTLWGFQDGVSTRPWTALEGAAGYQGATIHSELGGVGTGVNTSVAFAGVSQADALAKFTVSTGTVGVSSYLYIAYTG